MSLNEESATQQIDSIVSNLDDWRGKTLSQLRAIVRQANADLVEEVKWKKPSRPEGVPVWSYNGNICIADTLKNAVRLTFPKGAQLPDPQHLFNTRLDSKTVRAVDFYENSPINAAALTAIITEAIKLHG
ncbi:MAG: hypothetical protein JWM81_1188 [Candidatus Saccharibacteria bacterium]|nr:hypothetical protein [Candidatus Saccharibacteria bacterium]